ncbi:MAG: methyltransferase [Mycobacterium sp.]|jgi:SAM-dependent methyltransferase|nr:methyltransferase [Mycobacterium sp.]
MNVFRKLGTTVSARARARRAATFRASFSLSSPTRILDLGSETGANIHSVLDGTDVRPENVHIADIDHDAIELGRQRYGFVPVPIDESGRLPFPDGYFDVVYCSSVIEHVTVPKARVWELRSGVQFRREARESQRAFAAEVRRLGRQYFVQTPYRHFPIESHSWLPFVAWLPRRALVPLLGLTNRFWVKRTSPDWYLLDRAEMASLFGDARIVSERFFLMTKSLMAVRAGSEGRSGA